MSTGNIKKSFWGVKCGRYVGLTASPPSMSQMSSQCGILNVSRPPRPLTGIAFISFIYILCTAALEAYSFVWNDQSTTASYVNEIISYEPKSVMSGRATDAVLSAEVMRKQGSTLKPTVTHVAAVQRLVTSEVELNCQQHKAA
jgi:hypothetical protein